MIRSFLKGVVYLAGLAVLGYGYFFVPLGQRTLWQHTLRISATPEAQDLGRDVDVAADRVGEVVNDRWRELQDGGPAEAQD